MQKEVALQRLEVERERIKVESERGFQEAKGQTQLLWFSAFGLIIFSAVIGALVYSKHTDLALTMTVGLAIYVSVLLGRRIQYTALVGAIRALGMLRSQDITTVLPSAGSPPTPRREEAKAEEVKADE